MNKLTVTVLLIILAPVIGGLIYGFERIVKARMQRRTGPPLLQPFYDFLKLADKRKMIVHSTHAFLGIMHFFSLWFALAILLLYLKYKPSDLGIRLNGLILVIPIALISALVNRFVCPQSLTYDALIAETGGIVSALAMGIITAGLSEEFFKMVGQTRLGAYIQNFGLAWFITVVIWAFMHAPKWYSEDLDMTEAVLGSVRIIPIGLMWSYMTHRTKSIFM